MLMCGIIYSYPSVGNPLAPIHLLRWVSYKRRYLSMKETKERNRYIWAFVKLNKRFLIGAAIAMLIAGVLGTLLVYIPLMDYLFLREAPDCIARYSGPDWLGGIIWIVSYIAIVAVFEGAAVWLADRIYYYWTDHEVIYPDEEEVSTEAGVEEE